MYREISMQFLASIFDKLVSQGCARYVNFF